MEKNWTGNSNSIYKTLGASNHTDKEREINDYYATEPMAAELLLSVETFNPIIYEPSCGEGHLSEVFIGAGYKVISSDIVNRGYGIVEDFLKRIEKIDGDVITNPPYKYAYEFIEKVLHLVPIGNKVAMFLKIQFLEGKKRRGLFKKYPPKVIYVSSSRLLCAKNGDFDGMRKAGGSAVAYAWYIWEKGYVGDTIIKWIN